MAVALGAPALSGGEVYKNQLAAEKELGMATDVKVGKVDIFLFDCQAASADETFVPATPQGLSKEERMKLAKSLKSDTDKGGTTIYSSETEIIPAGSRRIPYWR